MLFVEPAFLFAFLPAVFLAYLVAGSRLRNLVLLIASLAFYALGEKEYVLLMLLYIAVNYALGRLAPWFQKRESTRQLFVVLAVSLNLLPLMWFKYAAFLARQISGLTTYPLDTLEEVHLPIGISFFSFQALSYVLDVSSGRTRPQRRLDDLALYVALFPQLIAGPIVRYSQIRDQLTERCFRLRMVADGARRFVIGAAKKLLLANPMAEVADGVFAIPAEGLSWQIAWVGALAYTFQIYFDFSGYSDMAIGLGRMFGFRIPRNFNYPYVSQSITEFWRRWHISLSSWFRDYLYIPLGGNRRGKLTTFRNLMIVFLLCGLWHGADWLFVAWGAYHGWFLVVERIGLGNMLKNIPTAARWLYAMLVTVVGWVLFRIATGPIAGESTVGYFQGFAGAMFGLTRGSKSSLYSPAEFVSNFHLFIFAVSVLASTPILLKTLRLLGRIRPESTVRSVVATGVGLVFAVLTLLVVIRASSDAYSPFIYFQF